MPLHPKTETRLLMGVFAAALSAHLYFLYEQTQFNTNSVQQYTQDYLKELALQKPQRLQLQQQQKLQKHGLLHDIYSIHDFDIFENASKE